MYGELNVKSHRKSRRTMCTTPQRATGCNLGDIFPDKWFARRNFKCFTTDECLALQLEAYINRNRNLWNRFCFGNAGHNDGSLEFAGLLIGARKLHDDTLSRCEPLGVGKTCPTWWRLCCEYRSSGTFRSGTLFSVLAVVRPVVDDGVTPQQQYGNSIPRNHFPREQH